MGSNNNSAAPVITLNTSGNVGIGTTTPSAPLDVYFSNANNFIVVDTGSTTAQSGINIENNGQSEFKIYNQPAGAPYLAIDAYSVPQAFVMAGNGKIGIGGGVNNPGVFGNVELQESVTSGGGGIGNMALMDTTSEAAGQGGSLLLGGSWSGTSKPPVLWLGRKKPTPPEARL